MVHVEYKNQMSLESEYALRRPIDRDPNYERACKEAAAENAARREAAFRALAGEGDMDKGLYTVPSSK